MENTFHNQFEIYNGPEPYVFVSYCHNDAETVLQILESLTQSGFRIWFDGGIPWTEEWARTILDRIQNCAIFLCFHSPASAQSEHCRLEIRNALDLRKPVQSVYLEDVRLSHGLDEPLAEYGAVRLDRQGSMEELVRALERQFTGISETVRDGIHAVSVPGTTLLQKLTDAQSRLAVRNPLAASLVGELREAIARKDEKTASQKIKALSAGSESEIAKSVVTAALLHFLKLR